MSSASFADRIAAVAKASARDDEAVTKDERAAKALGTAAFGSALCGRSFGDHLHLATNAPYKRAGTKKGILNAAARYHQTMPGHAAAFGGPWPVQSEQYKAGGARRFYAQPWPAFWRRYHQKIKPEQRTYNELIRHGQPCKLYVDVDAKQVVGPDELKDYHQRVQAFVGWVGEQLAQCWPELLQDAQRLSTPMLDVLWLDASRVESGRFSVHLIFNLVGNAMLATNGDLTRLVGWLIDRAVEQDHPTCTRLPNGKPVMDGSVYNAGKGHEMRILLSHKKGEPERPLLPFDGIRLVPRDAASVDAALFYRSLVGYQPAGAVVRRLLHCDYVAQHGASAGLQQAGGGIDSESSLHGIAIRQSTNSLSGPPSVAPLSDSHHGSSGGGGGGGGGGEEGEQEQQREERRGGQKRDRDALSLSTPTATGASAAVVVTQEHKEAVALRLRELLPRIEACISNSMLGFPQLRFLYWLPETGCLTFASSNRMCEIKGDMHVSNHVFYVFWIETGVFYQRCFNAECYKRYDSRMRELGVAPPEDGHQRRSLARGHSHVVDPELWDALRELVLYPRHGAAAVRPPDAKRPHYAAGSGDGGSGRGISIYDRHSVLGQRPEREQEEDDLDYKVREMMQELHGDFQDLFD